MAVVKFSKQTIQPNPIEIDYWVDIKTDPYGSVWKYYNGTDWVALNLGDGSGGGLPAFDYYTKTQINEMLNKKADIELVESKVDDAEFAKVIQNIEFREIGDDSMELVMLKYDGIVVGITVPIATETNAGMIAGKDFKNFVKQHQLQQLYTEMYDIVKEIREQYQPRLKAGKNIMIDRTTNTIHATGKISTDWNDLTSVPDLALQPDLEKEVERATNAESILDTRITSHVTIVETSLDLKADKADTYTKDQIDSKLSGVYRIKGSCLFEQLPTDPTVGDTWNILNDFTLNDEEHPFGTNVVYTDNGWDALAGIFDSSELEGDISGVSEALAQETIRAVKAEQANADAIVIVDGKLVNYFLKKSVGDLDIISTNAHAVFNLHANATNICGVRLYANSLYGGGVWTDTEKQTVYIQNNLVLSQLLGIGTNGAYFYYGGKLSLLLHEDNYSNYALPLTGGTVTGKTSFYTNDSTPVTVLSDSINAAIAFKNSNTVNYAYLYYGPEGFIVTDDGWHNSYKIWHEGNDGSGSGLDADKLDGVHVTNSVHTEGVMRSYKTGTFTTANQYFGNGAIVIFDPKPTDNDDLFENTALLSIGDSLYCYRQLAFGWKNYDIKYRYTNSSGGIATFNNWKTIAFTDSNITGNAATATKLATPVKLWGNDFDGSSDVNGMITFPAVSTLATIKFAGGEYIDGYGNIRIPAASNVWSVMGGTHGLSVKGNGNIGIGTIDPLYKLDVNGTGHFSNHIYINNDKFITFKSTTNTDLDVLTVNRYNDLVLGWGISENNFNTYIDGNQLYFRYGTSHTNGMIIDSSGNVGIGTTSPTYKLDVNGAMRVFQNENTLRVLARAFTYYNSNGGYGLFAGEMSSEAIRIEALDGSGNWKAKGITLFQNGNISLRTSEDKGYGLFLNGSMLVSNVATLQSGLSVHDQITSGDYVDWYGVSWSEDSSDPTCTRIGNMALHRSLPILSAMKGYVICNHNTDDKRELILPMDDNWTVKYGTDSNSNLSDAVRNQYTETMVKIPEFWYIDDYEPSTKTHNLKISQTAKAGWCHHKEAYVGAYEGYNDGAYYRSTKGVTPTVSVSRTTLRPLARENGYEDEYKWNIYTYEEHRAICHLFLVEYATRNSQAAVNTALTSDGFKQGGLGSGCTTGTVTINGVTTYSFIPTGTTDSLGNGSGQVAYTVTLTDADGNETDTVTRYANRYRGIENPFGHIWKHVDDIVNVYNANTTYKTVYKCNKPEHFATNKNAKYKPLCSFPGGNEGYLKEIKATINCDFFPMTKTGASSTTYWCDYSYDNTDTSEHCLFIGGNSVYGGTAGLFRFALAYGVGNSHVHVGSRLTYLPWAE